MSERMKSFIMLMLIFYVIFLFFSTIIILIENYKLKKPIEEAIAKCEENLIRSQNCYVVISAVPQIVKQKEKIDEIK
jgi:hypothetical protein